MTVVAPSAYRRGQQNRRFDLRAGHRHAVFDAVQAGRRRRSRPAACRCACARRRPSRAAAWRPAPSGASSARRRRPTAIRRLRRQQAGKQAHGRAGVAHVERAGAPVRPRRPTPWITHVRGARLLDRARPSARIAAKLARQSSLARKPVTSLMPSAMPASMSARCEMDLSPGTAQRAATRCRAGCASNCGRQSASEHGPRIGAQHLEQRGALLQRSERLRRPAHRSHGLRYR